MCGSSRYRLRRAGEWQSGLESPDQLQAQTALVQASGEVLQMSQARFDRGVDSYLDVLDAQRTWYSARQALIGTRLARLSNGVTLYKALGGGWSTPQS